MLVIILALDLSLNETGYCILENCMVLDVDVIKPMKEKEQIDRMRDLRDSIEQLILDRKITHIFIEGYSFGSRGIWTFSAGELGGAIKMMILDLGLSYVIVAPTMWKKFVVGVGNAKKEQILLQVYKRYGVEFKNNNMCDAYCIAQFAEKYIHYKLGTEQPLTTVQVECFKKFDKAKEDEDN